MWKPTQVEALWFHGGNLHQSRHYSQYLSLQLKARHGGPADAGLRACRRSTTRADLCRVTTAGAPPEPRTTDLRCPALLERAPQRPGRARQREDALVAPRRRSPRPRCRGRRAGRPAGRRPAPRRRRRRRSPRSRPQASTAPSAEGEAERHRLGRPAARGRSAPGRAAPRGRRRRARRCRRRRRRAPPGSRPARGGASSRSAPPAAAAAPRPASAAATAIDRRLVGRVAGEAPGAGAVRAGVRAAGRGRRSARREPAARSPSSRSAKPRSRPRSKRSWPPSGCREPDGDRAAARAAEDAAQAPAHSSRARSVTKSGAPVAVEVAAGDVAVEDVGRAAEARGRAPRPPRSPRSAPAAAPAPPARGRRGAARGREARRRAGCGISSCSARSARRR